MPPAPPSRAASHADRSSRADRSPRPSRPSRSSRPLRLSAELCRYLEDLVDDRIARALIPNPLSIVPPSRLSQPVPLARERIDFLDRLVREAPVGGIKLAEATAQVNAQFQTQIKTYALREFLRRYAAYHQLVVRGRGRETYVRLQAEAVIELLAAHRKAG